MSTITTHPRIANHAIDGKVSRSEEFTNYNATITGAYNHVGCYVVTHWNTTILVYSPETGVIHSLAQWPISQTTSRLVGRLLRNLPQGAVKEYLAGQATPGNRARLTRMAGL